mmetsp:Transcript_46274/g.117148  ORF Transcript_46274/g.117148 Transcript_46274/m.117148 type:complete len:203 (+) Transcript_46274:318-926(+)
MPRQQGRQCARRPPALLQRRAVQPLPECGLRHCCAVPPAADVSRHAGRRGQILAAHSAHPEAGAHAWRQRGPLCSGLLLQRRGQPGRQLGSGGVTRLSRPPPPASAQPPRHKVDEGRQRPRQARSGLRPARLPHEERHRLQRAQASAPLPRFQRLDERRHVRRHGGLLQRHAGQAACFVAASAQQLCAPGLQVVHQCPRARP